jgi:molybdopterin adenylyltransferase
MTELDSKGDARGTGSSRMPVRCAVLTISDRASRGEYADRSGPEVARILAAWGWPPEIIEILPDEEAGITDRMAMLADSGFDLIVTAGGTGLSARDRTPEATLRAADRLAPGIMEAVRARTGASFPRAYLSRGIAAMRERCLIVNLPGSVRGARESIDALADLLPHAIDVLREDPRIDGEHEARIDSVSHELPGSTPGRPEQ